MSRLLIENSSKFVRSFHSVLVVALAITVVTDLFSLCPELTFASEAPSNLVYQGRVIKPDSNPLEASSVAFDVSIYSQHLTELFGLSDKQKNQIASKADRTEVAILREKLNQLELKNESQNEQLLQQKKDNYELKKRLDRIETRFLSNK